MSVISRRLSPFQNFLALQSKGLLRPSTLHQMYSPPSFQAIQIFAKGFTPSSRPTSGNRYSSGQSLKSPSISGAAQYRSGNSKRKRNRLGTRFDTKRNL